MAERLVVELTPAQRSRIAALEATGGGRMAVMSAFAQEIPEGSVWVEKINEAGVTVWLELVEPAPTSRLAWDTGAVRDV